MESHVEIDLKSGSASVTGSEEFIFRILEWTKENSFRSSIPDQEGASESTTTKVNVGADRSVDDFANVYAARGDDVEIIAPIEGGSGAETARSVTLLYLFGRKVFGKDAPTDEQIRAMCEDHGCYDSKNFSSHMKGLRGKVIFDGSARSFTARLTAPGERYVRGVAEGLQIDGA